MTKCVVLTSVYEGKTNVCGTLRCMRVGRLLARCGALWRRFQRQHVPTHRGGSKQIKRQPAHLEVRQERVLDVYEDTSIVVPILG
jgi:hypothetical protein